MTRQTGTSECSTYSILSSTLAIDGRYDRGNDQTHPDMETLQHQLSNNNQAVRTVVFCICILHYGCERWTLTAVATTKKIRAFESKCFGHLLHISWAEHKTTDFVRSQISTLACAQEPLIASENFGMVRPHAIEPSRIHSGVHWPWRLNVT